MRFSSLFVALAMCACIGVGSDLGAETLVGSNAEVRTNIAFRLPAAVAQHALPEGWQVNPIPGGPLKGANLLLVLVDRLFDQGADEKIIARDAMSQTAVFVVPARRPETGAAGWVVLFGLSSNNEGAPGAYGNFIPTKGVVERSYHSGQNGTHEGQERWHFVGDDGTSLEVRLRYARGPLVRATSEAQNYSAANSNISFIYRQDQGSDVLRSLPAGVDRVANVMFQAAGSRLNTLFDGSEELIGIVSVPFYIRQTFRP